MTTEIIPGQYTRLKAITTSMHKRGDQAFIDNNGILIIPNGTEAWVTATNKERALIAVIKDFRPRRPYELHQPGARIEINGNVWLLDPIDSQIRHPSFGLITYRLPENFSFRNRT